MAGLTRLSSGAWSQERQCRTLWYCMAGRAIVHGRPERWRSHSYIEPQILMLGCTSKLEAEQVGVLAVSREVCSEHLHHPRLPTAVLSRARALALLRQQRRFNRSWRNRCENTRHRLFDISIPRVASPPASRLYFHAGSSTLESIHSATITCAFREWPQSERRPFIHPPTPRVGSTRLNTSPRRVSSPTPPQGASLGMHEKQIKRALSRNFHQ